MQLDFRYVHLALTAPKEVTVSFPHGIDIVESTKYMLNGFSETQLQRILLALDRAINTLIRIEHDLEPGLLIQRSDETDLHWMKLSEAQHNFDRDLDIPTVKNAHYYAVYALHQLGQSIKLAHDNGRTEFDEQSVRCLTDSVESLSLARLMQERGYRNRSHNDSNDFDANLRLWDEDLVRESSDADLTVDEKSSSQTPISKQSVQGTSVAPDRDAQYKAFITESTKKASLYRHKSDYEAQQKAIELFNQRKNSSINPAAKAIAPIVFKEVSTVRNWISAYKRDPAGFMAELNYKLSLF